MEKKAREIIGLPVVTMNRGTKIYDVEDLVLDPERSQVLALVVQEKAMFHSARAIPFGRINVIGQDAVVIPDGKAVIQVNRDPVLRRLYTGMCVRGLRVLTDDGSRLGTVDDMLVDTKTGEIKGYHVSLGRGMTMGQGSRWLPAERVLSIGHRVMFVPADVAKEFEEQTGGIAGALDEAGNKLRTAGSKLNTQLEQLGGQLHSTVPQKATGLLVGSTAHREVTAPDGTAIVLPNDTITEEMVDHARRAGRLSQLALSAGAGPFQQHTGSLGEQASQSLRNIPGEAKALWEQLTGQYTRNLDNADDKVMQRRIKNALGRPATRVILDNDDSIILNTGDIITNRAVQEARNAGVLDILVDSVYVERPKLTLEDLKAPRSGDAALDNTPAVTASSTPGAHTDQLPAATTTITPQGATNQS